jgi:hypothetical protein
MGLPSGGPLPAGRPTKERQRSRAYARATQRALWQLSKRYPVDFRDLLEAARAEEGIRTLKPREVAS